MFLKKKQIVTKAPEKVNPNDARRWGEGAEDRGKIKPVGSQINGEKALPADKQYKD